MEALSQSFLDYGELCDHMFHSTEQYSSLVIVRLGKYINSQIFQIENSTSQHNFFFFNLVNGRLWNNSKMEDNDVFEGSDEG